MHVPSPSPAPALLIMHSETDQGIPVSSVPHILPAAHERQDDFVPYSYACHHLLSFVFDYIISICENGGLLSLWCGFLSISQVFRLQLPVQAIPVQPAVHASWHKMMEALERIPTDYVFMLKSSSWYSKMDAW